MIVLALSTSCPRGSAAVVSERGTLARIEYVGLELHAERIFGAIDVACAQARVERRDLGAIACDVGPGSFTGVRVSVAAARGIAFALGVPAVGVSSLAAMAAGGLVHTPDAAEVVAMIDAKKDEVFVGRFTRDGQRLAPFSHVDRASAAALIVEARARGALVVGEIARTIVPGCASQSPATDLPDAELVGRIAYVELLGGREPPPEPEYVRAPDAKPAPGFRALALGAAARSEPGYTRAR